MTVVRAALGCVLAVVLTGCAGGGGDARPGDEATRTPTREPSTSQPTTEESATEESATPRPDGPVDGIPDDLLLPRQAKGRAEPDTDLGRLYDYICLDPNEQWTLGTGFVEARTVVFRRPVVVEKLAVYPSVRRSARAFDGLLAQVDQCGDGPDHVGNPASWRSEPVAALPGASDVVRLTYRSTGEVRSVVSVARVGRAIFYVDRRAEHDSGVAEDERTIAGFLPVLARAFS